MSLVPVLITTPGNPRGFRLFDDKKVCTFTKQQLPRVKEILQRVKELRKEGYNVYDSDEYIDDIFPFVSGELLRGEDVIWMFVIPQIYISLLNLTVIYGHAVITSWIRHFEFINRIFPRKNIEWRNSSRNISLYTPM